jgi:hypothetical protein
MKNRSLAIAGVLASLTLTALASPTPISTIQGLYGVNDYDTPELIISNTTADPFTNVTLTLTGYQGEITGLYKARSFPI